MTMTTMTTRTTGWTRRGYQLDAEPFWPTSLNDEQMSPTGGKTNLPNPRVDGMKFIRKLSTVEIRIPWVRFKSNFEPGFFCTNPVRQTGPVFPPVIPGVWLPLPNALMPLRCLDPLRPSKSPISDSGGGSHYHSPSDLVSISNGVQKETLWHILQEVILEVLNMGKSLYRSLSLSCLQEFSKNLSGSNIYRNEKLPVSSW